MAGLEINLEGTALKGETPLTARLLLEETIQIERDDKIY